MADIIFHNASAHSSAPGDRQRAVAVEDGRIAAIGGDEDVLASAGAETRIVDCGNRPLIPGFVDAHVHLRGYAETFFSVDCSPSRASSISAIQARIRAQAAQTPPGNWIRAHGYHQYFLDEGGHPTRWDLDAAAPRNPVRLLHQNRHMSVLNSLALTAAGISRHTPDPPGGQIERAPNTGEPTGLLAGMNQWLSRRVLPPLDLDQLKEGIRLASQSFLSQGVTCIHDASPNNGLEEWQLYAGLVGSEVIPLRLRMMVGLDSLDSVLASGKGPRHGSSRLRLGAVKIIVEEIGDRLQPSPAELNGQVRKAHDAGFQVAIHAITPKAVRAAIAAIKRLGDDEGRLRRHRIEHATYLSPALVRELAETGVVVVSQPSFIFHNGSRYLGEVPADRFAWICRGRSLLDQGVPVAGSTDCPVVPNSILAGVSAAVNRESQIGFVFGRREGVPAVQALAMFTAGGAYASLEEGEAGSIRVGNVADLVVLDREPLKVRAEEIKDIRVELVAVGGQVVWEREEWRRASNRP